MHLQKHWILIKGLRFNNLLPIRISVITASWFHDCYLEGLFTLPILHIISLNLVIAIWARKPFLIVGKWCCLRSHSFLRTIQGQRNDVFSSRKVKLAHMGNFHYWWTSQTRKVDTALKVFHKISSRKKKTVTLIKGEKSLCFKIKLFLHWLINVCNYVKELNAIHFLEIMKQPHFTNGRGISEWFTIIKY